MDLRLPAAAGELTRAEQKILDYINTNTDTFLFSSIGQLAERLDCPVVAGSLRSGCWEKIK